MRIGYLTYGLDRRPTGIGRYAVELLRAMAAIPDAPEIVLLTTERADPQGLWTKFERHALPGCSLLPVLTTLGHAAVAAAALRFRLDVIHDPNGVGPFLLPAGRTARVVTIHDAVPYDCPESHNHLDNWRYRWLLPLAARSAEAVVTVSQFSRAALAGHLGVPAERIRVSGEGIDSSFRPIPAGPERRQVLAGYGITTPYLLYVGALNPRKNLSRLLEAYAVVLKRNGYASTPRLVIVGKTQWRTGEMHETLERLQLGDRAHFTGYVKDEDLPSLYSGAECFLFPSLYEGFGLPPLEAMACGVPVITSNTSSLPEVVGDAALTVDPYDVDALAQAMLSLLGDEAKRADFRNRGLKHAARFTWERAACEMLEVYQAVAIPVVRERWA